ncbi:hypothetical protein JW835_15635 [bacterium]|nr:hypothetical protein [bacterium]
MKSAKHINQKSNRIDFAALIRIITLLPILVSCFIYAFEKSRTIDPEYFANPPKEYRQHAWLTYNLSNSTEESLTGEIQERAKAGLSGGFYLGMWGGNTSAWSEAYLTGSGMEPSEKGIEFLSDAYFNLYTKAIEAGLEYGNPPLVFYDEVGYPSGMAGGLLYSKYPEHTAKSLEKAERDVTGPSRFEIKIPKGMTVGAVRMNLDTWELVDISDKIKKQRHLKCQIPEGRWKVMAFYLDTEASLGQGRKIGYVDYLDEEAVRTYIELCYQAHYDHLRPYWGHVLRITHYDEPALHVSGGRAWTPRYNEKFEDAYGYNPMKYYPALFYDIGPETGAVRNLLWGFRTRLFSEFYIKQLDDWCREHDIMLSGHLDQEEIDNPVPVNGDLMLMFKHQQVPAIDDIWWWGRSNRAYKLVASSAYNWDKPFFMAETYAGYRENMSPEIVFKVALDQAAMGANFQVGALPRDKTPESDRMIGRLCYMLQHGRHVADVAILYPIASLQAAYRFGQWQDSENAKSHAVAFAREGGIVPPETDYIDLGELIFRGLRQDFTFLHPEVLQERCIIEGNKLVLNNEINRVTFSALIIPGCRVLSIKTVRQIQAFFDAGGTVITTKILAEKSAERGKDAEVKQIMRDVFGLPDNGPMKAEFHRRLDEFMVHFINRNKAGGRAYFLPDYTPEMIQAIMHEIIPLWDVTIEEPMWPLKTGRAYEGSLTCIHKVKDGRHLYFFANSSDHPVNTEVVLRDSVNCTLWNPMNGKIRAIEEIHGRHETGRPTTRIPLKLDPVSGVFFVQEAPE